MAMVWLLYQIVWLNTGVVTTPTLPTLPSHYLTTPTHLPPYPTERLPTSTERVAHDPQLGTLHTHFVRTGLFIVILSETTHRLKVYRQRDLPTISTEQTSVPNTRPLHIHTHLMDLGHMSPRMLHSQHNPCPLTHSQHTHVAFAVLQSQHEPTRFTPHSTCCNVSMTHIGHV